MCISKAPDPEERLKGCRIIQGMKPIYYLYVGALVLAGAVGVGAQGTGAAAPPKPPASAATLDKAAMETELLATEQKLNEAVAKGNLTAFKALVVPGGWSVDQGGLMSVLDFQKNFAQIKIEPGWTIADSRVVWIDSSSAVVTYKWTGTGTFMGQPLPPVVFASTTWTKRGGKWVAVFHQESTATTGK